VYNTAYLQNLYEDQIRLSLYFCHTAASKMVAARGAWVVQLVNHLTLDFGSGHGLRVVGLSPVSGSVLGVGSA